MRFRANAMRAMASAVAVGSCIAPLPSIYFEDPLFKDHIRAVLPGYVMSSPTLYVVYVSHKHLPLKMRTFIDAFVEYVGGMPASKAIAARPFTI